MLKKKNQQHGKIVKLRTKWINPYHDHPTDNLKIRKILDEKINRQRIIGLEARIEPGDVHQLHLHRHEYVIVYTICGKCKVTIGNKTKTILPNTLIFIPPTVSHRFENKFSKRWEAIAFSLGIRSKIQNVWLD